MPWSNNSGGPWGGGSSGGNGGGGGRNPWGNPPPGGGNNGGGRGPGGGGGPQPPNLDELFRQSQERLRRTFGGGGGGGLGGGISKAGLLIAGVAAVLLYAYLCFYRVDANEQAVVLRFGEFSSTQGSGAHFMIWPIDTVEKVPVTDIQQTNVGFVGSGNTRGVPSESLMLAGDENIIDIHFSVFWQIANPQDFLFNIAEPAETVKAVAESAMREVVGRPLSVQGVIAAARAAEEEVAEAAEEAAQVTGSSETTELAEEIAAALPVSVRATRSEEIRGSGRQQVMQDVQELIQETLDSYNSGIIITEVELDKADPPPDVIDAFRDVQAAQQDQDRLRNQADTYFNQIVARARGEAAEMLEQAEAYRARIVAEAIGQAARFESIYEQYNASDEAREVIRKRLYLETMERVFGGMNKIILDDNGTGSGGGGGGGVVPYLPLDQLQQGRRALTSQQSQPNRGGTQ